MRIGIVSDTHGCPGTWRSIFDAYLSRTELILHAGDLLYHGPRNTIPAEYDPKNLAVELNRCPVPIIAAAGNCDSEVDSMVIDFPIQSPYAHVFADGMNIVINHGHLLDESTRRDVARRYRASLFITGHTHIAECFRGGGTVFLNPGSPSMSKRDDKKGTIALLEDRIVRVISIADGETLFTEEL